MLYCFGISREETERPPKKQKSFKDVKEKTKPKTSFFRKMFSAVLFLTAVFFMLVTANIIKINFDKIFAYGIMFVTAILFMIISGGKSEKIRIIRKDRNIKKLLLTLGIVFIIVPFKKQEYKKTAFNIGNSVYNSAVHDILRSAFF